MARPVSCAPASASSRVVVRIANASLAIASSSRESAAAERPMMCDLTPHSAAWLPTAAAAAATAMDVCHRLLMTNGVRFMSS